MEKGEAGFSKKERESMRESVCVWPSLTHNPTRNPRPWLRRISHFRPPHRSSLVSIWSLEADRRSPAILAAENQAERRRSKLENRDYFTLLRRDFLQFWVIPPVGFCSSWLPLPFLTIHRHRESLFCRRSIVGIHGCRARFRCRCCALELTAGTIELNVIGTLRFELPGQCWLNSDDCWPARVFW